MHRLFAAMLALTCVVGSAPSFARAGFAHGPGFAHEPGRGGFGRNPTILFGARAPADAGLQPDSGPALAAHAGTDHQRAAVTTRVSGHDRNRPMTPCCSH